MGTTAVLVISGPIASGKSSAANVVETQVRSSGRTAAVVDLDRLYMMLDDASPMDDDTVWRLARRAAAALTDQFVADGIDLVIVEGTFWTPSEREQFTVHLASGVQPRFMTLQVSVAEALRRAQLDTGRRASRIPELLRASHAIFAVVAPIAGDVIVDTTRATKVDVVAAITAMLATSPWEGERELRPLIRDIDCLQVPVGELEAALAFYRDALGHALIWQTQNAAGLRMPDSSAELVVQTERPELEVNLSVASADAAAAAIGRAGGSVVVAPFDIAIGRCAVVQDPWGNRLVLLDHSRGRLLTDTNGHVLVDASGHARTQRNR